LGRQEKQGVLGIKAGCFTDIGKAIFNIRALDYRFFAQQRNYKTTFVTRLAQNGFSGVYIRLQLIITQSR